MRITSLRGSASSWRSLPKSGIGEMLRRLVRQAPRTG